MTFLTRNHRVQPDQREVRQIVVERDFLPPPGFAVAFLAAFAELPFMRILLLVA